FPIPIRHGMTIGELALLFNEVFEIGCEVEVIRMKGWKRKDLVDEKTYPFVPPSPNIPVPISTIVFPAGVAFEGTNVSAGRGTTKPFEWIGAPFIRPDHLGEIMNKKKFPGVYFRPIFFQPTFHKGKDQVCGGVQIHVTDAKA